MTAVVTGANSGIGFEVARALATRGTYVVLAVRSTERGQAAVSSILAEARFGCRPGV
jgi:NAD(P)-dependent dehydrogenase (short-subunit alcohol dehydrogenase family)